MRLALISAFALSLSAFGAAQALAAPAAPPAPAGQKVVKDAAEYNAYMLALNATDPSLKIQAFEAFLTTFPASILKTDALEQLMAAYQGVGDTASLEGAARRLVAVEPRNVRALVILAALSRAHATSVTGAERGTSALAAADFARRGLAAMPDWKPSSDIPAPDFARLKLQSGAIFNGALGFDALVRADWPHAKAYYREAVRLDPNDLQNTYQLAIAELQSSPLDPEGFWWAAKAEALATTLGDEAAAKSAGDYGRAKYLRYHGGADGWDAIEASAKAGSAPPAGFKVAAAPPPAVLAGKAVKENDPATFSVSDWEFVLAQRDASADNRAAADKVWATIQAKQKNGQVRLKLQMTVLALSADGFDAAISEEAVQARKPDVHVTLAGGAAPAVGAQVAVTGVFTGYKPQPFLFAFGKATVGP